MVHAERLLPAMMLDDDYPCRPPSSLGPAFATVTVSPSVAPSPPVVPAFPVPPNTSLGYDSIVVPPKDRNLHPTQLAVHKPSAPVFMADRKYLGEGAQPLSSMPFRAPPFDSAAASPTPVSEACITFLLRSMLPMDDLQLQSLRVLLLSTPEQNLSPNLLSHPTFLCTCNGPKSGLMARVFANRFGRALKEWNLAVAQVGMTANQDVKHKSQGKSFHAEPHAHTNSSSVHGPFNALNAAVFSFVQSCSNQHILRRLQPSELNTLRNSLNHAMSLVEGEQAIRLFNSYT
jgi:hypothetical protein